MKFLFMMWFCILFKFYVEKILKNVLKESDVKRKLIYNIFNLYVMFRILINFRKIDCILLKFLLVFYKFLRKNYEEIYFILEYFWCF